MRHRIHAFDNSTNEQKQEIEQNRSLNGYQLDDLKAKLNEHSYFINTIKGKLFDLLELKLESFNTLSHLMEQDEIDIFLINGNLLVNNV